MASINSLGCHITLSSSILNPAPSTSFSKISPWTFEIEFEIQDYKMLNMILKDMKNQFGDIIKRTEITLISEQFKGELNILSTGHTLIL
ncbi:hypothetical protein K9M79_02215 [Candidatus Woesearchaeota archaeon]|nr:hypothetical protein [Candidatus Woesearchaeota archaeon]